MDSHDIKDSIVRIETHVIELVKQGATHNELLRTHEARSLALQKEQEKISAELDPIKRHVWLMNALGALTLALGTGAAGKFILTLFSK